MSGSDTGKSYEELYEGYRTYLVREWKTRLELKRFKAHLFMKQIEKRTKITTAWQVVAKDDTIEYLEDEWEEARVGLALYQELLKHYHSGDAAATPSFNGSMTDESDDEDEADEE